VVHISLTRTGEVNSHHQQSPMRVEGIHTTGCCPVPWRDRLWHFCHHLSAVQPSARCLTPWLRWTRALFAVLGRCFPLLQGRLELWFPIYVWRCVVIYFHPLLCLISETLNLSLKIYMLLIFIIFSNILVGAHKCRSTWNVKLVTVWNNSCVHFVCVLCIVCL
jgi:hypothetical protein